MLHCGCLQGMRCLACAVFGLVAMALFPSVRLCAQEAEQPISNTLSKSVAEQDSPAQPVPSVESASLALWVEQLGDASFTLREQASATLMGQGTQALGALRAIPATAPFEMRQRAQLIQKKIEDDKFLALSRSFLLDLDRADDYGLPGWKGYRELVGSTRTSKLLFLELIRAQPEIAQLIELASDEAAPPAALRSLEAMACLEATHLREELFSLQEPLVGDAVAMLLVAATLPDQTPVEISEIIAISERRAFEGNMNKEGYRNCLRKLLAAWLPKTHASLAPTAMDCALRYNLSPGVDIARRHLSDNFDSDTRKLAFYCLAKFGDETDVPLLRPLLSDRTVVDEFARSAIRADGEIHESNSAPPGAGNSLLGNNMVVRISDLALTTSMLLLGEDPASVYPRYEGHPLLEFFIHSLASPADEADQQQQRIDQWKLGHSAQQVKS